MIESVRLPFFLCSRRCRSGCSEDLDELLSNVAREWEGCQRRLQVVDAILQLVPLRAMVLDALELHVQRMQAGTQIYFQLAQATEQIGLGGGLGDESTECSSRRTRSSCDNASEIIGPTSRIRRVG